MQLPISPMYVKHVQVFKMGLSKTLSKFKNQFLVQLICWASQQKSANNAFLMGSYILQINSEEMKSFSWYFILLSKEYV